MTQKPVAEWDRLAQCKHLDQLGDGDKEDNVTRDDEVEDNVKTLKEAINQLKELRLQLWVLLWCTGSISCSSSSFPACAAAPSVHDSSVGQSQCARAQQSWTMSGT